MEFWGIKIDKDLIPKLIVRILLAVLVVWIVKITLGEFFFKIILIILVIWIILDTIIPSWVYKWLLNRVKGRLQQHTLRNWTSDCIQRDGRLQRCDFVNLDLKNKYLNNLTFKTTLIWKNGPTWRAGFIIGNPSFRPEGVVDSDNAITCHTGQPPESNNIHYIWLYDETHDRSHPYSTSTLRKQKTTIFDVSITENNHLRININNQLVYNEGIPSNFRKKVYLIAWGDDNDCKVRFSEIKYSVV